MAASYIPTKDALFEAWDLNFTTLLTANPALYGSTAADAVAQTAFYTTWHAAFLVTSNPATKTKPAVAAKNAARVAATKGIRPLAQQIAKNPGVTNANKLALGLNLQSSTGPTPLPPPSSYPILGLVGLTPGNITLKFTDSLDGVSRKKPAGVLSGLLWGKVSATPITDPTLLDFLDPFNTQPFDLDTSGMAKGSTIYLAANWSTRTGLRGPWSPILSTVIV